MIIYGPWEDNHVFYRAKARKCFHGKATSAIVYFYISDGLYYFGFNVANGPFCGKDMKEIMDKADIVLKERGYILFDSYDELNKYLALM